MQRAFRITFARWSEFFSFSTDNWFSGDQFSGKDDFNGQTAFDDMILWKKRYSGQKFGNKSSTTPNLSFGTILHVLMKKEYSTISHKGLEFKYFFTPKS